MKLFHHATRAYFGMPKRDRALAILFIALFIISLATLLGGSFRFTTTASRGMLVEGTVGKIRLVNPLFVDFSETDRDVSELVFSGLVRFDPVAKNFFPDLAESWQRSNDGLTFTVKLRPNIVWHDGTPFTADDVLFTIHDLIQDAGFRNPLLKEAFQGITVSKKDAQTVVFILPKSNSYFISSLTVGILPKHLLSQTPVANLESAPFHEQPVGTGPYRVTSLSLDSDGDRIDLERFPEYYGKPPKTEKLRILTFPNEEELLDSRSALHSLSKWRLGSPDMQPLLDDQRFNVAAYSLNQFTALYLRHDHAVLKQKRIRQALAQALNKDALLQPGEQRIDTIGLMNDEKNPVFVSNPEAAGKTLDAMGFSMGPEGFRTTTRGEKITLRLLALDKTPPLVLEQIRNQWQTLGLAVEIDKEAPDTFMQYAVEGRYDVLLIQQNLGYNRDVYPLFHSSQIPQPNQSNEGLNFSHIKSFRTDGLTEAMRKEKDPKDKQKLLQELSRILADEVPVIFLSTPMYGYALDRKLPAFPTEHLDYHSDRLSILTELDIPPL